jgi:hypothetical protein
MLPDYTKRMWNSLTQLKEHIEKDGKEKVLAFDGFQLKTNKRTFKLYGGILFVEGQ